MPHGQYTKLGCEVQRVCNILRKVVVRGLRLMVAKVCIVVTLRCGRKSPCSSLLSMPNPDSFWGPQTPRLVCAQSPVRSGRRVSLCIESVSATGLAAAADNAAAAAAGRRYRLSHHQQPSSWYSVLDPGVYYSE